MHAMLNQIEHQLTGKGSQRGLLLQHLYEIQLRYSHIPPAAIELLAGKLDVTPAEILAVIDFYAFLHTQSRGQFDILFSDSITDNMLGNKALMQQLCERLGVEPGTPDEAGKVTVATTSCTGMCDQGPAILVNGLAVTRLNAERVEQIAKLVEKNTTLEQWPVEFFQVDDHIRRSGLLLQASTEPGDALRQLQHQGADRLLQTIADSGLRGRGGAGFNTATKWRYCRAADSKQRYVVCNADEGEPGTFKDRVLLKSYADEMIEGMTLCAGIIGAQHGFIYLRAEYRYLRDHLQAVLQRRREQGLLGSSILGQKDFHFDIDIHMGAGAYICGEESALIESLEGKRGIPRNRPPFPVTEGYLNQPTVVNNVETFFAATKIAVNGASWFNSEGTADSAGSKLLSISGDCSHPGIYEYPFGTAIRDILKDCGAEDTLAVQVAGAAGQCFANSDFDRSISFEDISTGGSFIFVHPAGSAVPC